LDVLKFIIKIFACNNLRNPPYQSLNAAISFIKFKTSSRDKTQHPADENGRNNMYITGIGGPMFTPVVVTTYGDPDPAEQKIIDFMSTFHGVEIMAEHGFLAGENVVVSAACPFYTA